MLYRPQTLYAIFLTAHCSMNIIRDRIRCYFFFKEILYGNAQKRP